MEFLSLDFSIFNANWPKIICSVLKWQRNLGHTENPEIIKNKEEKKVQSRVLAGTETHPSPP